MHEEDAGDSAPLVPPSMNPDNYQILYEDTDPVTGATTYTISRSGLAGPQDTDNAVRWWDMAGVRSGSLLHLIWIISKV